MKTKWTNNFLHFKNVTISLVWPTDTWPMLLQTALKDKAALSTLDRADYNLVKSAILKVNKLVSKAHRQNLRNLKKSQEVRFEHDKLR